MVSRRQGYQRDSARAQSQRFTNTMLNQLTRMIRGRVAVVGQWARGKVSRGYCTICECDVWFCETGPWLRDQYLCLRCKSIPRNRALIKVLTIISLSGEHCESTSLRRAERLRIKSGLSASST